jgi:predicted nucleic acid-binding protein
MGAVILHASVLIALVDAADTHHVAAREAIESARADGARLIVPVVAYAEFMVRPFLEDPPQIERRDGIIEAIPATVEPATREIGREAASLRAAHGRRMALPDAMIVATAVVLGADSIITADAGWPRIEIPTQILGGS